jgi:hypothetical protein
MAYVLMNNRPHTGIVLPDKKEAGISLSQHPRHLN